VATRRERARAETVAQILDAAPGDAAVGRTQPLPSPTREGSAPEPEGEQR
jgi:hypothetical protein